MAVYQEGADDKAADTSDEKLLPEMEVGDEINLQEIRREQHFTEPPPRFTEASLVKVLEGIRYWPTFYLRFYYLYFAKPRIRRD